jgi:site-specific DNA-methyltransferase (adenine-specific)
MTKLIHGDCIEEMARMDANSVDLTVTSPPYDNLRTYEGSLQWNEDIWKQVLEGLYRVTKDGGVVVWVVGDATIKGSETGTSFKQALHAMECGFNLHDTMIWRKTNPPPQTKEGMRYTLAHEYMFVFSKSKPRAFNPIMQPCKMAGAKTNNRTQRSPDGTIREDRNDARTHTSVLKTKPLHSVCMYANTGSRSHPAAFPEQLAHDHITSWSNEGDTVFDPFLGSGTTGKMAKQLNRNFIGIEKVEKYYDIAKERIPH